MELQNECRFNVFVNCTYGAHTHTHISVFPTRILNGKIMLASIKTSFLAAKFNDLFLFRRLRQRRAELMTANKKF